MTSTGRVAIVLLVAAVALSGCVPQPVDETTVALPTSPSPTQSLVRSDPVDLGPAAGAMGPVSTDAKGVPVSYTVVEGDSADLIRGRFDIWWDQLARDGSRLVKYPTLFAGDVLTFMPHDSAFEK